MVITPSAAQYAAFTPVTVEYKALRKGSVQITTANPAIFGMLIKRGYKLFLTWTVTETSPNHRIITNLVRLENK